MGGKRSGFPLMLRDSCQDVSCCRLFCFYHMCCVFSRCTKSQDCCWSPEPFWAYAAACVQLKIKYLLFKTAGSIFSGGTRTDCKYLNLFKYLRFRWWWCKSFHQIKTRVSKWHFSFSICSKPLEIYFLKQLFITAVFPTGWKFTRAWYWVAQCVMTYQSLSGTGEQCVVAEAQVSEIKPFQSAIVVPLLWKIS